jgi:hypothetical protein
MIGQGEVISREPIVPRCDAPEILQPVRALDAAAQLIDALAEAERLFPVAAIWNDRLDSALVQVFAQLGAIVGPCRRASVLTAFPQAFPYRASLVTCMIKGPIVEAPSLGAWHLGHIAYA